MSRAPSTGAVSSRQWRTQQQLRCQREPSLQISVSLRVKCISETDLLAAHTGWLIQSGRMRESQEFNVIRDLVNREVYVSEYLGQEVKQTRRSVVKTQTQTQIHRQKHART